MFRNREAAALELAKKLRGAKLIDPLVLGIPRGGVVLAAVLARELGASLDVVLSRKIRAPGHPELAIGAIGEDGAILLNDWARSLPGVTEDYIAAERDHQFAEIGRRRRIIRGDRPPASVEGRSVIVTDDGVATGATLFAALHVLADANPHERIVAVPVAPRETIAEIERRCDWLECLHAPRDFGAVGVFYDRFEQVEDGEVVRILAAGRH